MDCEESRRLLDDLSEGKLAKHKVRALQEHVRGCRECLKIWSRLKTTPGTGTPPGAKWEDLSGRTIAGHAIHEVAGRGGQATSGTSEARSTSCTEWYVASGSLAWRTGSRFARSFS